MSGLVEGLIKDDYADKDEWFTFKKRKNDEPQSSETFEKTSKDAEVQR